VSNGNRKTILNTASVAETKREIGDKTMPVLRNIALFIFKEKFF